MIFVTADSCRAELDELTKTLVSVIPGSTIYQHTNLCHVLHDVLAHHVDAVFLKVEMDETNDLEFVRMLRRNQTDLPVFLISRSEERREKAVEAGANGYFVQPVAGQQLKDAVRAVSRASLEY